MECGCVLGPVADSSCTGAMDASLGGYLHDLLLLFLYNVSAGSRGEESQNQSPRKMAVFSICPASSVSVFLPC